MALGVNAIRVLTTLCVVAATAIILLPLLARPAALPIHPAAPTTPERTDRVLDERIFGASPDRMILYTPPGFRGANERHAPKR
jgi:hypothetical protein